MAREDFKSKIVDGVSVDLSDAEIDECVAREEAWATAHAANSYIGKRQAAFASIGDQLDMQYWDAVNGTTTWKDHVAKVNSDNPKPD